MKKARRVAARSREDAKTRELILDAASDLLIEEGHTSVTSRRVEKRAGLRSQLIHYHFGSMSELFAALYERAEIDYARRREIAASAENHIRALWELYTHPQSTRMTREFLALSQRHDNWTPRKTGSG